LTEEISQVNLTYAIRDTFIALPPCTPNRNVDVCLSGRGGGVGKELISQVHTEESTTLNFGGAGGWLSLGFGCCHYVGSGRRCVLRITCEIYSVSRLVIFTCATCVLACLVSSSLYVSAQCIKLAKPRTSADYGKDMLRFQSLCVVTC